MLLFLKLAFALAAVAVFLGGIHLLRNFERIFGGNAPMAGENESTQLLNKTQMVVIWLLTLKLLVMMFFIF